MKKTIVLTLVGLFSFSVLFSKSGTIKKDSPLLNQGKYLVPVEKPSSGNNPYTGINFKYNQPRNMNTTLIDSSGNGYGLVVSSTRPIDGDDGNWMIAYRQFSGAGTTQGQLGGAFTEDLESGDWSIYTNINANGNPEWGGGGVCFTDDDGNPLPCAQARYPSAVASEDYPYAIWNEYTGAESTYGGRPYYTYDEFGWDGDSFAYPLNIDLLWGGTTDQWVGSAQYSFNEDDDMGVINVVYNDWTRNNTYLFHSEVIEDGLVIFGTEQTAIDLPAYLGEDGYITSPLLTMNDSGQGAVAVLGLYSGVDPEGGTCTSIHTCNHVPIFKLTDDHGYTFYGPSDGSGEGMYFIPDNVFDDIISENVMPNLSDCGLDGICPDDPSYIGADSDGTEGDGMNDTFVEYCYNYSEDDANPGLPPLWADIDYDQDGTVEEMEVVSASVINEWWSWYDWDMRVDSEGDIHVIMSVVPESELAYHFNIESAAGFYHLTIDRDYIDNPGAVNSPEGWNWTYLMSGGDTWKYDIDGDTFSEIFTTHPNLSFSEDDDNIMWAVISMANAGDYRDDQTRHAATNCAQWDTYIPAASELDTWSFDLWVLKSLDGGMTWSDPVNATNTGWDHYTEGSYFGPEEMYPHTPAYSDDDNVTIMYQVPNWSFNDIGDPTGADHMNWVYVGQVGEDIEFVYDSQLDISEQNNNPNPSQFGLKQNYPNPFNPSTTIDFSVPEFSSVNISVYDINGRLVNTLMDNTLTSGTYSVVWNGDDFNGSPVSAGIYMYSLTSGDFSITSKMVLVK